MESDNIKELVEKYFEATTTVAEEDTLRAYFSKGGVTPELEQYVPMFQYFSNAKEEKFTKQVPLDTIASVTKRRFNYKWLSVAAVGLLMFGIYFGKSYQEKREAEYAYQETKKAMTLLAQNFNRGTEKVAYLNQFEETKQKVYNK
ncbi:hypothetical protein FEE95_17385 [Maribacter algarum]|uniref:Uncharacterized protein n=1 Tax=Maribacter algarum (ex Zhang et al. 2020) TaxID=2578118 RepID=A0A5S3PHD0_9FLAO|nr:hypothetical protein [Maribacter algarum]TMM53674.1 hypothetical protein FEE95_17385 [Maribacter algarum]